MGGGRGATGWRATERQWQRWRAPHPGNHPALPHPTNSTHPPSPTFTRLSSPARSHALDANGLNHLYPRSSKKFEAAVAAFRSGHASAAAAAGQAKCGRRGLGGARRLGWLGWLQEAGR